MPGELAKKKRVRAGHRASVSRMVKKAEELLAADHPNIIRLSQLRLSLKEKLDVLGQLDGEILNLVEEEKAVTDEIEQSDELKEGVYSILVRIDGPTTPSPTSSTRVVPLSCPSFLSNRLREILRPGLHSGTHTRP